MRQGLVIASSPGDTAGIGERGLLEQGFELRIARAEHGKRAACATMSGMTAARMSNALLQGFRRLMTQMSGPSARPA